MVHGKGRVARTKIEASRNVTKDDANKSDEDDDADQVSAQERKPTTFEVAPCEAAGEIDHLALGEAKAAEEEAENRQLNLRAMPTAGCPPSAPLANARYPTSPVGTKQYGTKEHGL